VVFCKLGCLLLRFLEPFCTWMPIGRLKIDIYRILYWHITSFINFRRPLTWQLQQKQTIKYLGIEWHSMFIDIKVINDDSSS
jgi:hypothetical protein